MESSLLFEEMVRPVDPPAGYIGGKRRLARRITRAAGLVSDERLTSRDGGRSMCNHYRANARAIEDWAVWAGYRPKVETPDEIWPKRPATVARLADGELVAETMLWGIPRHMRGASGKMITKAITNVRNLDSPFWKSSLARPEYRCLVPFVQFAEPKPGKDPETGRPAEYWFSLPGQPVAAFAGIWRPDESGNHFAFLTCEPNPLVAPLHPKAMPVILQPEDYMTWLTGYYAEVCALAQPFPSQLMAVS